MKNRVRSLVAAAAVLVGAAGMTSAAAAQSPGTHAGLASHAKHGPRIVARPDNLMVDTSTVLSGSGFKPHTKLRIQECSAMTWDVPLKICNHPNTVRVRTDAHGRFKVNFKAMVCPFSRRLGFDGFSKTCYVGVPHIQGVDTITLLGGTKLVVTGP
jgi:hypothetical protein